jgi:hypothetical protein
MHSITRNILASLAVSAAALVSASGAEINSSYIGANNGLWNVPTNWSPNTLPMNGGGDTYNVTVTSRFVGLNVDTTISNLTLSGSSGRITATDRNLTVDGATSLLPAGRFALNAVANSEVKFDLGTLSNFSGTNLNSGSYFVSAAPGKAAKLQFDGANIATNSGTIVLAGVGASIIDENGLDALRNFTRNLNFVRILDGRNFTAANLFTNEGFFVVRPGCTAAFPHGYTAIAGPGGPFAFNGTLEVFGTSAGSSPGNGLMDVTGGSFSNYDSATKTLSQARLRIASFGNATARMRFTGADIVHNNSQLELGGSNSGIVDENGLDGLRNLASNNFYFGLWRRAMTIAGNFANTDAMDIYGGGDLTVVGSMSNTGYCGVDAFDVHLNLVAPGFVPSPDGALSSKLTVGGNFTSGPNAVLLFEVVSPSITTSMQVNGTTALDGNLVLYFTFDDSQIASTDTLTLITSNAGFTGAFDNVASGQRVSAFSYDGPNAVGSFLASYAGTTLTVSDYQFVPKLAAAVSRKTHGSAGPFDIPLPLTGAPGVECRSGNGTHTLVFSFNKHIVSGTATVTSGIGTVMGAPSFAGETMTVTISASDVQQIAVSLSGVTDAVGQVAPTAAVVCKLLIGDTNGDSAVTGSDISQTKSEAGAQISTSNFRTDNVASGAINSSDIGQVKAKSGNQLTATGAR